MFKEPGTKLKNLSFLLFILTTVSSIVLASVLALDEKVGGTTLRIILFVSILIGGTFGGYLNSLFVYGFGELIERAETIEYTFIKSKRTELKPQSDISAIDK